jgi:hypothetical protein
MTILGLISKLLTPRNLKRGQFSTEVSLVILDKHEPAPDKLSTTTEGVSLKRNYREFANEDP